MTAWRIGTGLIEGRPEIVIAHEGGYTLLGTILGAGAPPDTRSFIAQGSDVAPRVQAAVDAGVAADLDGPPEWAPPVMPSKLICIGANYAEHNAEMLGDVDNKFPYAFLKPPTTTLIGSGQPAPLPGHATEIDYEAELSVVIGRRARSLSRDEAPGAVFGYAVLNDLSARELGSPPERARAGLGDVQRLRRVGPDGADHSGPVRW